MRRARLLLLLLVPIALAVIVGLSSASGARRPSAVGAKPYTASLKYTETNPGRTSGMSQLDIQGKGTFAVKLGAKATFEAALMAMATGVPVAKIAEGGSYKVERSIGAHGTVTGIVVAHLKAPGLGTVCLTYTQKPGKYVIGMSFVPMYGTVKTVGGTGAAARWRISFTFTQTSVSGISTEQFGANGSLHASLGSARPMTAACKHVAALG
jgi:hypothetical protein